MVFIKMTSRLASADRSRAAVPVVWLSAMSVTLVAVMQALHVAPIWGVALALAAGLLVVRTLSPLLATYVVLVFLSLVVAPRIGQSESRDLSATDDLAALWMTVAATAGVLSSAFFRRPLWASRRPPESVAPALAVSAVALIIELFLLLRNWVGVASQLAGGSVDGGYAGLLAATGPPFAAAALISAVADRGRLSVHAVVASGALVALHAVVLVFSGFRGAAPIYIGATVLCGLGQAVRRRTGRSAMRQLAWLALLVVVCGTLVLAGSSVRAALLNQASLGGKEAVGLTAQDIVPAVMERLDQSVFLQRAFEYRGDSEAHAAIAVHSQLEVVLPRVIFPDKSPIAYGKRVAQGFYNVPETTRTSQTITTAGDAVLNFGFVGGFLGVGLYLFILDMLFRRLMCRATIGSRTVVVVVTIAALNREAPIILNTIEMVRDTLVVAAMIVVSRLVSAHLPGTDMGRQQRAELGAS